MISMSDEEATARFRGVVEAFKRAAGDEPCPTPIPSDEAVAVLAMASMLVDRLDEFLMRSAK
jgi:hypothetical protein